MKSLIFLACLLQAAFAAPQLISFKDGKVGVNFLGYHAEAGLGGGGQNGGLLGGLHASAGTPWGQNAAAGLGGNVNGRATGMLYAGAQATPDVGAGAVLGGDTSQGGFSGSQAYANGKVASRTHTIVADGNTRHHQQQYGAAEAEKPPQTITENSNAIQKIRPPKKYYSSERFDFINTDNNDDNNGIALYTNKTKNIYDIEQQKPATNFITKPTNKTTISTPFQSTAKDVETHIAIETAAATFGTYATPTFDIQQPLTNDADNSDSNHNYQMHTNAFNNTTSPSLSLSAPTIISYDSLSHLNADDDDNSNSNGRIADGVITTTIIARDRRTKLRNRQQLHDNHHHHHHRHRQQHPKRIHLNQRQRQRSKTIVKVLEQVHQQPTPKQYHLQPEELPFIDTQQKQPQYYTQQQQHPVRRQLIAPTPAQSEYAEPCEVSKPDCVIPKAEKHVRSDVVQNALQIPIGILQSLQNSFGNFGAAPV